MRTFYKFFTYEEGYLQQKWTFRTLKEATEEALKMVGADDRLDGLSIYKIRRPDNEKDADELGFFMTCDEEDEGLWDIIETWTEVRRIHTNSPYPPKYENVVKEEGRWEFINKEIYEERKNASKN